MFGDVLGTSWKGWSTCEEADRTRRVGCDARRDRHRLQWLDHDRIEGLGYNACGPCCHEACVRVDSVNCSDVSEPAVRARPVLFLSRASAPQPEPLGRI